nr:hypothetical protein [Bacillota bacterium]
MKWDTFPYYACVCQSAFFNTKGSFFPIKQGFAMNWPFSAWIENQQLLCVTIVQRKKGRRTVFGRLLQVDTQQRRVLVYDDDQKCLHHLQFNEIDDIQPMAETIHSP